MSVRERILNNFGWKVMSLLAATLTWLTIHSAKGPAGNTVLPAGRITLTLPVSIATAAGETRSFRITPGMVTVTLGGDPELVGQLKTGDVDAFVNLTDAVSAGRLHKTVRVRPPAGLNIIRIEPGDVDVEISSPSGSTANHK